MMERGGECQSVTQRGEEGRGYEFLVSDLHGNLLNERENLRGP